MPSDLLDGGVQRETQKGEEKLWAKKWGGVEEAGPALPPAFPFILSPKLHYKRLCKLHHTDFHSLKRLILDTRDITFFLHSAAAAATATAQRRREIKRFPPLFG